MATRIIQHGEQNMKRNFFSHVADYWRAPTNRVLGAASTNDTFKMGDSVDVPFGDMKQWDRTTTVDKVQMLNREMWQMYNLNPLIWVAVEMTVRMIVGSDVKIVISDKLKEDKRARLKDVIDRFWLNPLNNWPTLLPEVVRDLELFGEVIHAPIVDKLTGEVESGFIPPEAVREIKRNPLNYRRATAIVIRDQTNHDLILPIISRDRAGVARETSAELYAGSPNSTTDMLTGRVMWWSINRALTAIRGHGDFTQAMKPARDALRIVSGITDRTDINNRIVMELIFPDGTTQAEINAMLNPNDKDHYINPPRIDKPGMKMFPHTANLLFKLTQAQIPASETADVFKMIKAVFLAALAGLPEHWVFGQGEDVNRASASEMGKQAYEFLSNRQTVVRKIVRESVDFAVDQDRIFTNDLQGMTTDECRMYEEVLPEINLQDLETESTVGKTVLDAITATMMNNGMTQEEAASAMRDVLQKHFGIKIKESVMTNGKTKTPQENDEMKTMMQKMMQEMMRKEKTEVM